MIGMQNQASNQLGGGFGSRPVIWLEDIDLDDLIGEVEEDEETADDVIQTVKEASDRQ